jgi:nitrogen fixation protein FixH
LAFEAVLRHPTDLKEDRPIALIPMGEGKYKSALDMNEGSWQLRATAQSGEQAFRFQHSFRLP